MKVSLSSVLGSAYAIVALVLAGIGAVLGLLLVFTSVLAGLGIWVASLVLLCAGVLAFPPTRRVLANRVDVDLTAGASVAVILTLSLFATVLFFGSFVGGLLVADTAADTTGELDAPESDAEPVVATPDPTPEPTPESVTETPDPTPREDPNRITGPPETLLPTIDDFGSGWMATGSDSPGEASFYNVDTDTVVLFNVSIHDSTRQARSELRSRRPTEVGIDEVSVGDEGYLYKYDRRYVVVQFRVRNVVGRVTFDGGSAVFTPENNAVGFARTFADSIGG